MKALYIALALLSTPVYSTTMVLAQPQDSTLRLVYGIGYISVSGWDKDYTTNQKDLSLTFSKKRLGSIGYFHQLSDPVSVYGGIVLGEQTGFNEGKNLYPEFGVGISLPKNMVVTISYDSLVQVPVIGIGGYW